MAMLARRRLLDHVELNDHEKKNLMILDTIRKKGPIARAEISRLIGLNIVTVTSYVDQYIKKEVIKEVGIDVSSGGRKPTLIDLNPHACYLIGVGLNLVDMITVLCDLKGKILYRIKKERPIVGGETLILAMIALVEELIQTSNVDMTHVHGIGFGIPGVFNRETNSVRWPVGLLDEDMSVTLSITHYFEKKFGIPAIVDNDANTAVMGEDWYGQGLGVQNAIYLYSGNGCGIMINGQIYRGANGCAGEWLFGQNEENPLPALMESYKSGMWNVDMGISLKAKTLVKEYPKSRILQLAGEDINRINVLSVVKAVDVGDQLAERLIYEAGVALGQKAAFLVNLFNPEILVIGGGIEICGAVFMDAIRDTVKKRAVPEATEKLRIVPAALGENGVALGAAALVAQNYFVGA